MSRMNHVNGITPFANSGGHQPRYQGSKVHAYSAQTRNAAPNAENGAMGSKATYDVKNNPTSPAGATIGQVRSDYKASRQAGFTPDQARLQAVTNTGDNYRIASDYKGQAW